jgi:hypothetical protein
MLVVRFANAPLTITDTGDVAGGQGSKLLYTFPKGLLQFFGANVDLTIGGDANLAANAALVGSIGKVAAATDNATLSGDEVTFVAASVYSIVSHRSILGDIVDNTSSADRRQNYRCARLSQLRCSRCGDHRECRAHVERYDQAGLDGRLISEEYCSM